VRNECRDHFSLEIRQIFLDGNVAQIVNFVKVA
jgi:hypothetical protein